MNKWTTWKTIESERGRERKSFSAKKKRSGVRELKVLEIYVAYVYVSLIVSTYLRSFYVRF